MKLLNMYRISW